ncbi:MAG: polymorphic toxin-type HINT domain-containing protein [Planctomycetaceae bacterium]
MPTQLQNDRICKTLAEATGQDLPSDPELWWSWWQEYNQLYCDEDAEKPTCWRSYCEENAIQRVPLMPLSCLVAGTPVWTDRGLIAVEDVRIGDLALAQHPETGELAYKPVLQTTVRPESPVFKLTAGETTFRATGGHAFWVGGEGWRMVSDLEAGAMFHGIDGPVRLDGIKTDGEEQTYNLVVADFHTYFVGPSMVLSHDPTFAEPTDALLPGLQP